MNNEKYWREIAKNDIDSTSMSVWAILQQHLYKSVRNHFKI